MKLYLCWYVFDSPLLLCQCCEFSSNFFSDLNFFHLLTLLSFFQADGVLGGGVQAVVISTVLIVIFAEIIPQSVCSRFGLAIGSAMVYPVRVLIFVFYIVAWPVSRILSYFLGDHSGVVYRRAELKELVNLHSIMGGQGDLDQDTVTIVGATLDLQTKVVSDAMTPIQKVFQLPITSKLDYETLGRVLKAGHSRIPVYEEVAIGDKIKKRIIGVLLTKQLILLDPEGKLFLFIFFIFSSSFFLVLTQLV